MKDTIRLSRRNKERLLTWNDDANRAIEALLDAYDNAMVREKAQKKFEDSLRATGNQFTTGATYGATYRATYSSQPTPTLLTTASFADDYWKKMKTLVDSAIEPHVGR